MVTDLISCGNGVGTQPVPIFREIARINTDLISCGNGVWHGLTRMGFPAGMGGWLKI